ncbi:hypothetical protein [Sphingomonas sp. Y38-1Y]|uniref:hypothetical protein n=1 Tax=Sphingomonas sp. Y38-1Y TaxID=3078265 RepID=UPI0028E8473D|nr:hypothetical protein [Sphingomonas sp. Y38-1Y]
MADPNNGISEDGIDSLSVAPPDPTADADTATAGGDGDISQDGDAVDIGSEDSMDASDPPSTSAPGSQRDVEQAGETGRQHDA